LRKAFACANTLEYLSTYHFALENGFSPNFLRDPGAPPGSDAAVGAVLDCAAFAGPVGLEAQEEENASATKLKTTERQQRLRPII
jgi:hypothetical protein